MLSLPHLAFNRSGLILLPFHSFSANYIPKAIYKRLGSQGFLDPRASDRVFFPFTWFTSKTTARPPKQPLGCVPISFTPVFHFIGSFLQSFVLLFFRRYHKLPLSPLFFVRSLSGLLYPAVLLFSAFGSGVTSKWSIAELKSILPSLQSIRTPVFPFCLLAREIKVHFA